MNQNNSPEYADKKTKKLGKSLLTSTLLLLITVAIFSAQTYAYFWDSSVAGDNKIITGTTGVEILEVESSGNPEVTYAAPAKFVPGTRVNKIVRVKNTGNIPVYVRFKIEKTLLNFENEISSGWEDFITCNIDPQSNGSGAGYWISHDGYYYYYSKLEPQGITEELFDKIYFSIHMGNEFANADLEFKVVCQTVQANGNSDSPLTAWGWPADVGGEPVESSD